MEVIKLADRLRATQEKTENLWEEAALNEFTKLVNDYLNSDQFIQDYQNNPSGEFKHECNFLFDRQCDNMSISVNFDTNESGIVTGTIINEGGIMGTPDPVYYLIVKINKN